MTVLDKAVIMYFADLCCRNTCVHCVVSYFKMRRKWLDIYAKKILMLV